MIMYVCMYVYGHMYIEAWRSQEHDQESEEEVCTRPRKQAQEPTAVFSTQGRAAEGGFCSGFQGQEDKEFGKPGRVDTSQKQDGTKCILTLQRSRNLSSLPPVATLARRNFVGK